MLHHVMWISPRVLADVGPPLGPSIDAVDPHAETNQTATMTMIMPESGDLDWFSFVVVLILVGD